MSSNPLFFSKTHIEIHRFNAPASLAEEAVHCLELVAEMVEAGLDFQFKGGNSLLLILPEPKRFSIDVDIATNEPRERIEAVLNKIIVQLGVFTRLEKRQHKTKPWLPIASYYLFFKPAVKEEPESSIMLDVQLRRTPYRTERKPVVCGQLYQSHIMAELPLPSSLIGDKLLTLGPSTLGIPVGKGKEAQRLKHVFDVARLVETNPPPAEVRDSFLACLQHENEIQDRGRSTAEIIADTLDFCKSVEPHDTLPDDRGLSPIMSENVRGLPVFVTHLFDSGYGWRELKRDMAIVSRCVEELGREISGL
jgi:hypothetical protein